MFGPRNKLLIASEMRLDVVDIKVWDVQTLTQHWPDWTAKNG